MPRWIHIRLFVPLLVATACAKARKMIEKHERPAIRPAVVTRKVCGDNRFWAGTDRQQILATVIRTASQRDLNPHVVLDVDTARAHAKRRHRVTLTANQSLSDT